MKVSLAWIFDHIDASYQSVDVAKLVTLFNQKVAEIEGWYKVTTKLDALAVGQVVKTGDRVSLTIPEWGTTIELPARTDAHEKSWYLVCKEGKSVRWATSLDLGAHKQMQLPAMSISAKDAKGGWKKKFEQDDYILEVDNKSITHRPDMWGHRGFAREIAVLLDKKLIPLADFLSTKKTIHYDKKSKADKTMPFAIQLEDMQQVKRFAGLYVPHITHTPSLLWMVSRLARVDARSLDAIVDCTNYVMLDTSQPMHAFDAAKLSGKTIQARYARAKEAITLLDDQKISLNDRDMVVADERGPVALAGIMGGKETAVSAQTTSLFLESANFNATTIRVNSQRHKVRTEASARFEKKLDPNQNVDALRRFVKLLDDAGIAYEAAGAIVSVGPECAAPTLDVSHEFIEKRLGASISQKFITSTLTKLGFSVKQKKKNNDTIYHISVPPFRASKDVAIKEDIVEEIGRLYGYDVILPQLPYKQTKPTDQHAVMRVAALKKQCAFGLSMHELYSYSFFDESFLRELQWDPDVTEYVKDPVSENWYRLVTTLMPHMLRAVAQNAPTSDSLRFFEWARVWHKHTDIEEKKSLTGIMYEKKRPVTFYEAKAQLQKLFAEFHLTIDWMPVEELPYPWFDAEQTAHLYHEGTQIGIFGKTDASFFKRIADGGAYLFELNGDFLESYKAVHKKFVPLAKYPEVERDISMMVPLAVSVAQMTELIHKVDSRIVAVSLQDFFQKKEWANEKSLTFRYVMREADKTMIKADVDAIVEKVSNAVHKVGASIR